MNTKLVVHDGRKMEGRAAAFALVTAHPTLFLRRSLVDYGDNSSNSSFQPWWIAVIVASVIAALLLLLLIVALFRRHHRERPAQESPPPYLYPDTGERYSLPPTPRGGTATAATGSPGAGGGSPFAIGSAAAAAAVGSPSGRGGTTRSAPVLLSNGNNTTARPPGLDRPSMYEQFHNPIFLGGEGDDTTGLANWQDVMSAFFHIEQEGAVSSSPAPPPPPEPPLTSLRGTAAMAAMSPRSGVLPSPRRGSSTARRSGAGAWDDDLPPLVPMSPVRPLPPPRGPSAVGTPTPPSRPSRPPRLSTDQ